MDFDGWCTSLALVSQHPVVDSHSNTRKKKISTAETVRAARRSRYLSIIYTSSLTASGFALPSLVVEFSLGLGSSALVALSLGDWSAFDDRFNCECSQHLVDVHIFAYFFRMAFSAAITSSYDGGKTLWWADCVSHSGAYASAVSP